MKGLIKGRAQQIVHACIEDYEFSVFPFFDVQYFRDQISAVCDDRASQFEMNLLMRFRFEKSGESGKIRLEIGNGFFVRFVVVDP